MDPLYGGNSLKRPRVDDGAPPPMPSGGPPMGMMPPPPAGYGVGAPMQQPMYGGAYGQPPPPMGVMGGVGGGYGGGFMGDGGMPSMQPPPYGGMPPSMPPQMQIPPPPSYHMPPQPLGPMPPPMPPPVTPQLRGQYLRRALEALSKEALIKMFTDVALKHGGTVFDAIYNAACTDTVNRRVFVRDVAWGTTDASLKEVMLMFGDVAEANVVRERNTGKSKGFAFVVFEHGESAQRLLDMPLVVVDGRQVHASMAGPRDGDSDRKQTHPSDSPGRGGRGPRSYSTRRSPSPHRHRELDRRRSPSPHRNRRGEDASNGGGGGKGGGDGDRKEGHTSRRSLPGPDPAELRGQYGVIGAPQQPAYQQQQQQQAPMPPVTGPPQQPLPPPPGGTYQPPSSGGGNNGGGAGGQGAGSIDPAVLARRIFVQGLPYSVDGQQLKEAFRRDGEVEDALVVRDPQTQKSRGFGFVTFKDPAIARRLLSGTRHRVVYSRACTLGPADEAKGARGGGGGGGGNSGSTSAPTTASSYAGGAGGPVGSFACAPAASAYPAGAGQWQQPPQQQMPQQQQQQQQPPMQPYPGQGMYGQQQQAPSPQQQMYPQQQMPQQQMPQQQMPQQQTQQQMPQQQQAYPPPPQGYADYRGWM